MHGAGSKRGILALGRIRTKRGVYTVTGAHTCTTTGHHMGVPPPPPPACPFLCGFTVVARSQQLSKTLSVFLMYRSWHTPTITQY